MKSKDKEFTLVTGFEKYDYGKTIYKLDKFGYKKKTRGRWVYTLFSSHEVSQDSVPDLSKRFLNRFASSKRRLDFTYTVLKSIAAQQSKAAKILF